MNINDLPFHWAQFCAAFGALFHSSYETFWSDVLATLVGGVLLALLFFLFKEKFMPLPAITGRWYVQQVTHETAYRPYQGMVLRYVVMLCREGNRIEGTAEKIYENSTTGSRTFSGKHRTRAEVFGYVEKKYLGRDRVFLHMVEDGHGRESTYFYEFKVKSGRLIGSFASMVADQDGPAECQRASY